MIVKVDYTQNNETKHKRKGDYDVVMFVDESNGMTFGQTIHDNKPHNLRYTLNN